MTADGGGAGTHTYAWDSENWLKSVDAASTTYTYDAIHWRAKKQTGATGKLYWYDVNTGEVLTETALDGSSPREFIYFAGQRVARRNPDGTVNYRFLDHLGSLRVMTDSQGTIVQELDYDPFGYSIPVVSNPPTDDPYQFISKERDAESLNDHYWFRQFSPRLARWCSADPLGGSLALPQSLNRYSYVLNNPTNFIDPLALTRCELPCHLVDDRCVCPQTPTNPTNAGGGGAGGDQDYREALAILLGSLKGDPQPPEAPENKKPEAEKPTCEGKYKTCLDKAQADYRKCLRDARIVRTVGGVIAGGLIGGGATKSVPGAIGGAIIGGYVAHDLTNFGEASCLFQRSVDNNACHYGFTDCTARRVYGIP